jgi:hypothetical protein
MLSGDILLWKLWLLCTSSMISSNVHASSVRFFLNRCSCWACKNSSPNVFSYATCTKMSLEYLLSRVNMSYRIPPFHQNAYPSSSLAWIAKKCMTPICGILIAIDLFRCSIFARSGHAWLYLDSLAANSHHR